MPLGTDSPPGPLLPVDEMLENLPHFGGGIHFPCNLVHAQAFRQPRDILPGDLTQDLVVPKPLIARMGHGATR